MKARSLLLVFLCVLNIHLSYASSSEGEEEYDEKSIEVRLTALEKQSESIQSDMKSIKENTQYLMGGMTDYAKNIRSNLPMKISLGLSVSYMVYMGATTGGPDVINGVYLLLAAYGGLKLAATEIFGRINTPQNKS